MNVHLESTCVSYDYKIEHSTYSLDLYLKRVKTITASGAVKEFSHRDHSKTVTAVCRL